MITIQIWFNLTRFRDYFSVWNSWRIYPLGLNGGAFKPLGTILWWCSRGFKVVFNCWHKEASIEDPLNSSTPYCRDVQGVLRWSLKPLKTPSWSINWFGIANGRPFAVPNQSVHGKYNLISVWFNTISKRFLCLLLHRGKSCP